MIVLSHKQIKLMFKIKLSIVTANIHKTLQNKASIINRKGLYLMFLTKRIFIIATDFILFLLIKQSSDLTKAELYQQWKNVVQNHCL